MKILAVAGTFHGGNAKKQNQYGGGSTMDKQEAKFVRQSVAAETQASLWPANATTTIWSPNPATK